MDPRNIDYAKLLLDEWKYRHEMFFKLLFRYSWISIIAGVLPALAVESPVGAAFFQHVREGGKATAIYWTLVALFFIAANLHLATEYRGAEHIRDKLRDLREETKKTEKISVRQFFKRALLHESVYVIAFSVFFAACFYYQRGQINQSLKTAPSIPPCISVCGQTADSPPCKDQKRR